MVSYYWKLVPWMLILQAEVAALTKSEPRLESKNGNEEERAILGEDSSSFGGRRVSPAAAPKG